MFASIMSLICSRQKGALPSQLRRPPSGGQGPRTLPSVASNQWKTVVPTRSEEHTSELQSRQYLVCRLLLEKKKNTQKSLIILNISEKLRSPLTVTENLYKSHNVS